jgi:hypothetical protein
MTSQLDTQTNNNANKLITKVLIGNRTFEIKGLYNFSRSDTLFYCGTCLLSFDSEKQNERHALKCKKSILNSEKVYEEGPNVVYKVVGRDNISFCQSLCNLGRCFIENKTLFLEIENYNFYLLFNENSLVGYFSDEILNENHNLSCILILPDKQKMGFGKLLVDLSYKFKKGTPEKPFSVSGSHLYHKYWKNTVRKYLEDHNREYKSIEEISNDLNMTIDDVIIGLENLEMMSMYL